MGLCGGKGKKWKRKEPTKGCCGWRSAGGEMPTDLSSRSHARERTKRGRASSASPCTAMTPREHGWPCLEGSTGCGEAIGDSGLSWGLDETLMPSSPLPGRFDPFLTARPTLLGFISLAAGLSGLRSRCPLAVRFFCRCSGRQVDVAITHETTELRFSPCHTRCLA